VLVPLEFWAGWIEKAQCVSKSEDGGGRGRRTWTIAPEW